MHKTVCQGSFHVIPYATHGRNIAIRMPGQSDGKGMKREARVDHGCVSHCHTRVQGEAT
jgi:hypothetical protein